MKILLTLFVFSVLLFSCNQKTNTDITQKKEQAKQEKVVANKMLTFEIEGMTCVMGCGGSIKKELAATNAVEKCEFEFEEGRKKNIVKVSFDENKTSVKNIIHIVTKMNDNQFTVGETEENDISVNIKTTITDVHSAS
jgi:periplasmic mercuric ion binding protein